MEDSEMQRIHCDIIQEEIPPTPEHIGTSAQEIKVIDINDTNSDEECRITGPGKTLKV